MRRRLLGNAVCSAGFVISGCYASEVGTQEPPVVAAPEELACAPSELALAWSRDDLPWSGGFHPASLEVAPGGALLVRRSNIGGASALRLHDGSLVASLDGAVLDAAFARSITIDPESQVVSVRELATGAVLRTIAPGIAPPGTWLSTPTVQLSRDGERAFVLECAQGGDATRTVLRAVDVASGATREVELAVGCGSEWIAPTQIVALDGGDTVLLVGARPAGPEWTETGAIAADVVVRIDVESGAAIVRDVVPGELVSERGWGYGGALMSSALSSDEQVLAVTTHDGKLHRLDTASLEEIGTAIDVGVLLANELTYAPSWESPVAISESGALIAHVDVDGTIVVRDVATSAVAARLDWPGAESETGFGAAVPMALRFVRDGLLASGTNGVARFGCAGVVAPPETPAGELRVHGSGPSSVRVGDALRFELDVEGAALPTVRAVRIGDETTPFGSFGRVVETWAWGEGPMAVELVADDGVRSAREASAIEVLPSLSE